jgi:hypothetical protein
LVHHGTNLLHVNPLPHLSKKSKQQHSKKTRLPPYLINRRKLLQTPHCSILLAEKKHKLMISTQISQSKNKKIKPQTGIEHRAEKLETIFTC